MSYDYSENILVQESAGNLLRDELGWDVQFAYNTEILGKNGTFGRESYNADRCASISWVKPLIEDDGNCISYRLWVKYHDKTKRNRYYIWCAGVNYMVILEDRDSHYKLITAYNVLSYKIKGYEKEYNNYIKTKTPT